MAEQECIIFYTLSATNTNALNVRVTTDNLTLVELNINYVVKGLCTYVHMYIIIITYLTEVEGTNFGWTRELSRVGV